MRSVVAYLRISGHTSVVYLDDLLLIGNSFHLCLKNRDDITRCLLEELGFVINEEKSQLVPLRSQKYLGFLLNAKKMLIKLPDVKRIKVRDPKSCAHVAFESSRHSLGYSGHAVE